MLRIPPLFPFGMSLWSPGVSLLDSICNISWFGLWLFTWNLLWHFNWVPNCFSSLFVACQTYWNTDWTFTWKLSWQVSWDIGIWGGSLVGVFWDFCLDSSLVCYLETILELVPHLEHCLYWYWDNLLFCSLNPKQSGIEFPATALWKITWLDTSVIILVGVGVGGRYFLCPYLCSCHHI